MAIAHLCSTCGVDLCRERPRGEPVHGLPVLTCPRCGTVALRTRHPASAWWRRFRRLLFSLAILVLQVGFLGFLTAFTIGAGVYATELLERGHLRFEGTDRTLLVELVLIFAVLPIALGVWLTAGLPHLRFWQAWLGWAAWIGCCLAFGLTMMAIERYVWWVNSAPEGFDLVELFKNDRFLAPQMLRLVTAYGYVGPQLAVAILGVPIGRVVLALLRAFRRAVWRMHRRRLRGSASR